MSEEVVSQPNDNSAGRRRRRIFCPHCEEYVSKTTYYRHRDSHYDVQKNEWRSGHYQAQMDGDIGSSSDDEGCDMALQPVLEPQFDMSEDLSLSMDTAAGLEGEH